ncbi:alpha/beta hydrolase [Salinisphaera sp. Q1T1-3]|uniref:alpha/beta hydrolase n=1 Tax=Salinisphaera sp. Q1T1-3 TaxID=2321229 RepID=UPI001313DD72|nr:alpha/beta hydrolase-fold protein [Salinisphaera sp. Q1T1-3]
MSSVIHPAATAAADDAFETTYRIDTATGQCYEIAVHRPRGPAPAGGFPALVVFDGNHTASLAREWLATRGLSEQVVLVGIGYPNTRDFNIVRRYHDFTPIADPAYPGSGGASRFADFVIDDVLEHVAGRIAIDASRLAVFGHSLGALAVLTLLMDKPAVFTDYWIASPALWWADDSYKPYIATYARAKTERRRRAHVLVTVGAAEQPVGPLGADAPARALRQRQRRMVDNARWLGARLASRADLTVIPQLIPGADHGQALRRGLCFGLGQWTANRRRAELATGTAPR